MTGLNDRCLNRLTGTWLQRLDGNDASTTYCFVFRDTLQRYSEIYCQSFTKGVDRKSENEKETEVPWDEIKKGYSKEIVLER